jgi:hypothetical protein
MSSPRIDAPAGLAAEAPAGQRTLADDESRLFTTYANRLRRTVGRIVNTTDANLDDACVFAWPQLLSRQPRRETVSSPGS